MNGIVRNTNYRHYYLLLALFLSAIIINIPTPVCAEEAVLRLLIWEGHAPPVFVSRFEKQIEEKYGSKVKLQISYMDGTDGYYDLIRSGSVDMVMLTHDLIKDKRFNFIDNKLLLPLDLKNIPNFKHMSPTLQNAEYLYSNGHVYGAPESQGPYVLAYNKSLLKEAPKSWDILWNPQFKDKYIIGANEYPYNTMITALALGYPRESLGNYDALNNPTFKKKLRQLAVNAHAFWIGVDKADDLFGHLLATVWGDSLGPLKQRGEQWERAEPVEGTPFWIDNMSMTSALADKPFLKKVAEEYINELLSTDYQISHILRVVGTLPVISDIDNLLTPEEKQRIKLGTINTLNTNRVLLPTCSRRDRNGLRILWQEAMEGIAINKGME